MRPKTRLNFRHFSEGVRITIFGATWGSRPPIWTKNRCFLSKNRIKNYCRTCVLFCFDLLANFGRFFCLFSFLCFVLFLKNVARSMVFTVFSALPAFVEKLFFQSFLLNSSSIFFLISPTSFARKSIKNR